MKFLGHAKKFFNALGTEPEPTAQHFNVRCVSGHRVRGERTEGYQALRCPACGEGVFVLPRSPLPAPPAPPRQGAGKSMRADEPMFEEGPVELTDPARVSVDLGGDERALADADIVWDDALPEPPPQGRAQAAGRPAGRIGRPGDRRPAESRCQESRKDQGGCARPPASRSKVQTTAADRAG